MRAIVENLLWTGNVHDLHDVRTALSFGIRAIVDLAANEAPAHFPRDMVYCRIPLNDGAENEPAILRLALASLAELIQSRVPTLVACSAGMSRSPATVAAALSLVEKRPPDGVLLRIAASGPHDVAPALWRELKQVVATLQAGGCNPVSR